MGGLLDPHKLRTRFTLPAYWGLPCALPSAPHVPALCPIAPAFDRALGGAETCSMGGDKARGVPPKKAQLAALRPFRPPGRPPQPDHRGGGVGKNQ